MDPAQQTASDYYKHHRKHSLFSRITIISSMAILLLVLAVNISALSSQQTASSHAATPEQIEKLLPSLPPGCVYLHDNGKVKVDCRKPTPTISTIIPINVELPKLPPECSFETTTNGSKIQCGVVTTPIPTVSVALPATCVSTNQSNKVSCKDSSNQATIVNLPHLPQGCAYSLVANQYYVVCEAK